MSKGLSRLVETLASIMAVLLVAWLVTWALFIGVAFTVLTARAALGMLDL